MENKNTKKENVVDTITTSATSLVVGSNSIVVKANNIILNQ